MQGPERHTEGGSPPGAGCLASELDLVRARLRACETQLEELDEEHALLKVDYRALMANAVVSVGAHVRIPRQPLATLVCEASVRPVFRDLGSATARRRQARMHSWHVQLRMADTSTPSQSPRIAVQGQSWVCGGLLQGLP